jgi:hypothetical protein
VLFQSATEWRALQERLARGFVVNGTVLVPPAPGAPKKLPEGTDDVLNLHIITSIQARLKELREATGAQQEGQVCGFWGRAAVGVLGVGYKPDLVLTDTLCSCEAYGVRPMCKKTTHPRMKGSPSLC